MITIYGIDGTAVARTDVCTGSVRRIELMGDDYIRLKFSLAEPAALGRGCWCCIRDGADADPDAEGAERFALSEPCWPTFNTATGGWDYDAQMSASHLLWKNKLFRYNGEVSWTLTGLVELHLYAWCKSLNDRASASGVCDTALFCHRVQQTWRDGWEKAAEAKTVTYDCADYITALNTLADTYEFEWWFTRERVAVDDDLAVAGADSGAAWRHVLNIGKCELGEGDGDGYAETPVFTLGGFGSDGTCTSVKRQASSGEYASRLYAYGSAKNITARYRKTLEFEADTVDGSAFSDSSRPLKTKHFADSHKYTRTLEYAATEQASFSLTASDTKTDTFTASLGTVAEGSVSLTARLSSLTVAVAQEDGLKSMSFEITPLYTVTYTGSDSRQTETGVSGSAVTLTGVEAGMSAETETGAVTASVTAVEGTASVSCRLRVTATASGEAAYTFTGAYTVTAVLEVSATNAQSVKAAWCLVRFASNAVMEAQAIDCSGLLFAAYYNTEMKDTNGTSLTFETPTSAVEGNAAATARYLSVETGEELDFTRLMEDCDGSGVTVTEGDTYKIAEGLLSGKVPSGWYARSGADTVAKQQVTTRRLALPQGVECVEIAGIAEDGHVEKSATNEDIYPTTECEVDSVTSREREIEDETTGDVLQTYTQYYLHVSALADFKKDYIIEGETLHVVFKSGKLNGFDFEVGESWSVEDGQMVIPVVYQDTDDYIIPNIYMYPQAGDTIVLYGYDSTYLSDEAVEKAELELQEWAVKKLADMYVDGSSFECTQDSADAYNGGSPVIYRLGQKARLSVKALIHGWQAYATGGGSESYTADGSGYMVKAAEKDTRVIAVEHPLDFPYDAPVYTLGNSLRYSRLGRIESSMAGKEDKETTFKS